MARGPDAIELALIEATFGQVGDGGISLTRGVVVTGTNERGLIPAMPLCRISLATILDDT